MILLWKYKKVIANVTSTTFYENHHFLILIFFNILLLKNHLIQNVVFKQQPAKRIEKKIQPWNVFLEEIINTFSGVVLKNYVNSTRKNWQNIIIQVAEKNSSNKNINYIIEGRDCNNEFSDQ